ncbi:hypothetical protein DFH08DRAFT_820005 [Mycena albidolilacea]|uniref:Uncharacterized protein n=1 Tax=Mycena albidolilacea TaxID=1033008 RepID=A0AAD6ZD45_9AGAR|nr:hypothetical protein DFH08DRAFT_820005 [Mycena albidolilacea]
MLAVGNSKRLHDKSSANGNGLAILSKTGSEIAVRGAIKLGSGKAELKLDLVEIQMLDGSYSQATFSKFYISGHPGIWLKSFSHFEKWMSPTTHTELHQQCPRRCFGEDQSHKRRQPSRQRVTNVGRGRHEAEGSRSRNNHVSPPAESVNEKVDVDNAAAAGSSPVLEGENQCMSSVFAAALHHSSPLASTSNDDEEEPVENPMGSGDDSSEEEELGVAED